MLVLNEAWDILTTLTPADYSAFRDALGQSVRLPVVPVPRVRVPARQSRRGLPADRSSTCRGSTTSWSRPCTSRRSTTTRWPCWRSAGCRSRPMCSPATSRSHMPRIRPSSPPGRPSTRDTDHPLGPVRAGRGTRGPRGGDTALALPPRDDGRAGHRRQARHGRDAGRAVPARSGRDGPLPGALAGPDGELVAGRPFGGLQSSSADLVARRGSCRGLLLDLAVDAEHQVLAVRPGEPAVLLDRAEGVVVAVAAVRVVRRHRAPWDRTAHPQDRRRPVRRDDRSRCPPRARCRR